MPCLRDVGEDGLPVSEPLSQNKGPAGKQRQSKEYQAAEGSAL